MPGIEWEESKEYQPAQITIRSFCQDSGLSFIGRLAPDGLIVFVEKQALEGLHEYLASDVEREHGGVLVGKPFYDPELQRDFAVVKVAIPAQETEGSPVHLQFTPETWAYISGIIEENYPDMVVIGWYHSHPGLGVFMSSTDRGTQRAFYGHSWNFAIVVDPIAKKTGWFAGPECLPMNQGQVVLYQNQQSQLDRKYTSSEERDYFTRKNLGRLNWLLPFCALITILLLTGLWILNKDQKQVG